MEKCIVNFYFFFSIFLTIIFESTWSLWIEAGILDFYFLKKLISLVVCVSWILASSCFETYAFIYRVTLHLKLGRIPNPELHPSPSLSSKHGTSIKKTSLSMKLCSLSLSLSLSLYLYLYLYLSLSLSPVIYTKQFS